MRIFIGIDIEDNIRRQIARFLDGVRGFASDVRWVNPDSLHITLKFIGEQNPEQVEAIRERLRQIQRPAIEVHFGGYGFFPSARAPRVFWIGIQSAPQLAKLAADIDGALTDFGIEREQRDFSPHLTLARGAGGSGSPKWRNGDRPNSDFAVLQKRMEAMPALNFGTMAAREFVLYQSQLSPKGSKYTKLQRYSLATSS